MVSLRMTIQGNKQESPTVFTMFPAILILQTCMWV